MLKKLQTIICLLFLFILSVKGLYANEYFSDDFNYMDTNKWNYLSNGGQILFIDGVMDLSSSVYYFPYITNSVGYDLREFEESYFEFKFNYKYIDYMGNGIGIGYTGNNGYPYYQFSVWNDLTAGPVLQYQDDDTTLGGTCNYSNGLKKISLVGKVFENTWHVLRIDRHGNSYTVKLDSDVILSTNINQCTPLNLLIGNPLSGGRTWWNELSVDYVKAGSSGENINNKIIILPGLGASWNPGAILTGSTSPSYHWTMTPFVKNYDLLVEGLEANNLVKGQDFYIWNYDWRKPLSQIVSDFNNFVLSLDMDEDEKVDLVGHSLGGLVARIWTQDHPLLVDKSISLGSPHFGAVKAYEAWNGAKISDNLDVASLALNVFLQLQKNNFDTSVQTLRNYAPIVFDLSPTFTFLKRNGVSVSTSLSQYLSSKNNLLSTTADKLITVDGVGEDTKEWLNLGERSLFDKVLGIWEEGRPVSFVNGLGDATVLKKSASILNAENVEYISNHGELVDKSVNFILDKLDLGTTLDKLSTYPLKQTVFYLGSPATMKVKCGEQEFDEVNGWVIADNWGSGDCDVSLTGKDGGGTYHLVVGDYENWQYFEGEIADQEIVNIDPVGVESRWLMLEKNLFELGASSAVVGANQRDILKTIDEYIKFRSTMKLFKYSEEILENMRFILNLNNYSISEIDAMYKKAKSSKSLVETNLRLFSRYKIIPKYSAALNYDQANNLMNYGKNYAANYLANKLYEIVWK